MLDDKTVEMSRHLFLFLLSFFFCGPVKTALSTVSTLSRGVEDYVYAPKNHALCAEQRRRRSLIGTYRYNEC